MLQLYSCEAPLSTLSGATFMGYSKLRRMTGSVLCAIALWDCFGDTISSYWLLQERTGNWI